MFLPKTNSVVSNHMKNDLVSYSRILSHASTNKNYKVHLSQVTDNTVNLRKGTGGRSSFSGIVATVFGSTGFFGKYIINQLGKIGSQVVIPYRGTSHVVRELRLMGDLGQILFLPMENHNDENIRKAIKYSNVVINLIGKDTETSNFSHESVHVDMAARIARISKEMGVEKLIHMSALNASPLMPEFVKKHGSSYLKTKGQSEIEVKREFPDAIIFRPSDMFGHIDRFLIYFQRPERRLTFFNYNLVPLWRRGLQTIKQPVFASDVAQAMINAVTDPTCKNVTIEAVGPYRYRLDHLLMWICMTLRLGKHNTHIVDINPLFKLKIKFHETIKPKYPILSMEKLERECVTDATCGLPSLEDLGVTTLTTLEDRIHYELRYKRKMTHYWDAVGEIPDVPAPPRSVY